VIRSLELLISPPRWRWPGGLDCAASWIHCVGGDSPTPDGRGSSMRAGTCWSTPVRACGRGVTAMAACASTTSSAASFGWTGTGASSTRRDRSTQRSG